jgi:integrase
MPRPQLPLETWGKITRLSRGSQRIARISFRDSDGVTRRIQRAGKTHAQAERLLLEAIRTRLAPTFEVLTADSTILEAITSYLDAATKLSDSTINVYRNATKSVVAGGFGSVMLREVTVPRVERFLKTVTMGSGPSQAKTVRTILNNALTEAVRLGAIPFNPVSATTVPQSVKKPIKAPSLMAVREIRSLIRRHDEGVDKRGQKRITDIADLVDLYAATGARTNELLALVWDDIDLNSSPARLTINKTLVTGTDGKLKVQDHPKTSRGIRSLKLPQSAADILTKRRINSHSLIVFPSSTDTYRWSHNLRRIWREALEGTPYETWTPRDFRKAVATIVKDEMGIEAARDQLGHTSENVTIGHYVQPTHEGPDATEVLERLFEKGG